MDQSKACSQQEGDIHSKGGDMQSESSYEGEVVRKGDDQIGNHGFRERPSHHWMEVSIQANVSSFNLISISIKWLNLSIFVNIILALIVLSSITKKREIVTNMAPFMSF